MNIIKIIKPIHFVLLVLLFSITFISVWFFSIITVGTILIWVIKTNSDIFMLMSETDMTFFMIGYIFATFVFSYAVACFWFFVDGSIMELFKKDKKKQGLDL